MIITCPHCQTKYQVTYEAIGSAGRKVQCAHCQQAWQQRPLDKEDATPVEKAAFEAIAEDGLDEVMAAEEKAAAAEKGRRAEQEIQDRNAGMIDPAVVRKRQRAFSRRQNIINASQPLARLRRSARVVASLALCAVLAGGYFARMQVVQRYPAMAGVYEAIGLGVNVVGLEFSNVTTLQTLRDGKDILIVSAQIVGLMPQPTPVPAVIVTLIGANGQGIYEWSITPGVRDLMAGERATFDTQLTLPPGDASRVRLSFAGGSSIRASTAQPTTPEPASTEHGATEAPAPTIPEQH